MLRVTGKFGFCANALIFSKPNIKKKRLVFKLISLLFLIHLLPKTEGGPSNSFKYTHFIICRIETGVNPISFIDQLVGYTDNPPPLFLSLGQALSHVNDLAILFIPGDSVVSVTVLERVFCPTIIPASRQHASTEIEIREVMILF
jgi:hypothetical protein